MRLACIFILFVVILSSISVKPTYAIENPFASFNNKFGIHILFAEELQSAAKLVNSNGGDWGYVTIPIQAGDKDLIKWQNFMNTAKQHHIIPIVRLATEGDYFNTSVWRKPTPSDVIDFANFLDSLDWPVKNRYILFFNEVNRGDEWGGAANPQEYAELLSYGVTVFKSKSQNFFMISSGLDNAAPNQGDKYINQYHFIGLMHDAVPGIFNQIDGLGSHSYPNPAFSQPPEVVSLSGIGSFKYELDLVKRLGNKELPVFITETGWSTEVIPDETAASYYAKAFDTVWNDPRIVAVTPFLLHAADDPFQKFSMLGKDGLPTKQYEAIQNYPKVRGIPAQEVRVLSAVMHKKENPALPYILKFPHEEKSSKNISISQAVTDIFKWFMRI